MYHLTFKNGQVIQCKDEISIFEAAKENNILLPHSCLSGRCESCKTKKIKGKTKKLFEDSVLTKQEHDEGYILTCNSKVCSDVELDLAPLDNSKWIIPEVFPAKINEIVDVAYDVRKIVLRLPPNKTFYFNGGQYVNISKNGIKRSYSIAEKDPNNGNLSFYIKNYKNGVMSSYFFEQANINDLLQIEGPFGSFIYKEDCEIELIVFLATGTGIAPVSAILQELNNQQVQLVDKKVYVILGTRFIKEQFWTPNNYKFPIEFIRMVSRPDEDWKENTGYVQNKLLELNIDLSSAQVYACGSDNMIHSAKELLLKNNLKEDRFYADAFVQSN